MSLRAIRRLVAITCLAAIGGMIAASVADNDAAAMTAGSVAAITVLCLLVATSATRVGSGTNADPAHDEALGAHLEAQVAALVEAGADEREVRDLVATAVRLGRTATIRANRTEG